MWHKVEKTYEIGLTSDDLNDLKRLLRLIDVKEEYLNANEERILDFFLKLED